MKHIRTHRGPIGRMMRFWSVVGLVLLMASTAWAISPDNVIQMHKSGLPPQVIIQTIQSTGSSFSLTDADKKNLKEAGVPQSVIDIMLASGGGGAPAPEPAPEPEQPEAVDELEQLRQAEEADKEKIEADMRIREAAERAADVARKKIAAEQRKRIAKALDSARDALEDRRYYLAAQRFDEFVQNAPDKTKPSVLNARLGKAKALLALKLYGNAAGIFHDLLSAGPDSDVFVPAFVGLRKCARQIAYNPVTLEALASYFIGNQKQSFQDEYNYFLGKFFFDYNRNDEAVKYLTAVSEKSRDYADSRYLIGLVGVQSAGEDQESSEFIQNLVKANEHFQLAVLGAQRSEQIRIASLAYLALARIAYTLGQYDAAIYYYRKIPADSTSYIDALHESAWSYFLKGDFARGMGIFHTLDGPDWDGHFLPDTYLLEATVFTNKCHFEYARDALKRIEDRYLSLKQPLGKYMGEYASPDALYEAFVLKRIRSGVELPRLLRMAIISNPEFYDLYTSVTRFRREVARIRRDRERFGSELAQRLLETVESRKKERTLALGIKLNQLLQQLDDELTELEIQVTEIRIEIDEAAAEEIEKAIKDEFDPEKENVQSAAAAEGAAMVLVGDKYVTWPFEGEYWADEINNYRSSLTEVCK